MTRVVFPDHLLALTGGRREVDVQARNVRELLIALEARFPGSEPVLAKSAIAIDGLIHQDAYLEEIGPESEVFFLQRLEGG
jgi:molybdopterin synthase sulfur carrier subunit